MTKREADKLVHLELGKVLSEAGFRLKNREMDGFIRPFVGGKHSIVVPFYDYKPEFIFTLTMGIRIDEVDDITNQFFDASPRDKKRSETALVQPEYFFARRPAEYSFTNEGELASALTELVPVIRVKIVPFLDKHKDVASVDKLINCEASEYAKTIQPGQRMTSITLAYLAGNPEFKSLVDKHQAELERSAANLQYPKFADDLIRFKNLVEYLKNPTVQEPSLA